MLSRPLPQSGRTGLIPEFDHPVAFDDFPGGTISSRIAGLPPVPISTRQPASFICRACSVTAFLCGAATCRGFGRLLVPLEVDQDDSTASMTLGCTAVTGDVLRGWGASTIAVRARFLDVWVGIRSALPGSVRAAPDSRPEHDTAVSICRRLSARRSEYGTHKTRSRRRCRQHILHIDGKRPRTRR